MENRSRWRVFASGALMFSMLALTVEGQNLARRPVELDGNQVTNLYVSPGGSTAQDPVTPGAMFYSAAGTGYISGCWGHGGGIAWADEMRLVNTPVTGGEVDWYSFNYAMGYGFLFGYCVPNDPPAGDCDCYCPTGGLCDEGDPDYNLNVALYDAPPGPGCGAGAPIVGTEALITSSASRPLGDRSITATIDVDPKVLMPGNVVWGVVITDQEDAWLAIGSAPHVGTSTMDGAFWLDADSDGTWDTWECWPDPYGWTCPGCSGWMVWSAAGNADVVYSMIPVPPPAETKHAGAYTIDKNGATLAKGDEVVFMEIRVTDWDPGDAGILLKAWQADIDGVAGYSSGMQGTLAPHAADCTADAGICTLQMGTGSSCPFPPGPCPAGYVNSSRADYIFFGTQELKAVDISTVNFRYGSALNQAPIGSTAADYYLATLVLYVPDDAKGTFTIPFLLTSQLVDAFNQNIPLVGYIPGQVTVTTGRCCFGLGVADKKAGCIEDVTANQCVNVGICKGTCAIDTGVQCVSDFDCELQTGVQQLCNGGGTLNSVCAPGPKPTGKDIECAAPETCVVQGASVLLTDGSTCADECIECLGPEDCDDGIDCTNDDCVDLFCENVANDAKCDDGLACTGVETCDPELDCQAGTPVDCDDGLACTADACNEPDGTCTNEKTDCSDADPCTIDSCVEPDGTCSNVLLPALSTEFCPVTGANLDECLANTIDQYTGLPVATAWSDEFGCCLCVLCDNHVGCDNEQSIVPACRADIYFDIAQNTSKPNGVCFGQGEKVTVDVYAGESLQPIFGAQFVIEYDPACVAFNSISPGGDPFVFEIEEIPDRANGRVFYAVGVEPFGGQGAFGPVKLATASFTKLGHGCTNCTFDFGGTNPMDTFFVNDEGQLICADPVESDEIHYNDRLTLDVPEDVKVNVDCDTATAVVTWDAPTASSSCFDPDCDESKGEKCYDADLMCGGTHESGKNMDDSAMGGGIHPQGVTTYWCTATGNICGHEETKQWTVTVNDTVSLDVEVQMQPKIRDDLTRCITFELYADCVKKPLEIKHELLFGGIWDFVGHFRDDDKKIPKGQYECITARDRWHSLRSVSDMVCIDGVYHASFKGDPFFDGNWLTLGNIDTWKKGGENISTDVIDILDFGVFVWQFGAHYDSDGDGNDDGDTPCPEDKWVDEYPHADINGDGMVDHLDFTFIMMNFLTSSKDSCCPDKGGPAAPVGLEEISVAQLRQMGLGELVVADLNGDGLVNVADMSAFMNGQEPNKKNVRVRDESGLGSR